MTTMSDTPAPLCSICRTPESDHVDRIHPFTAPGDVPTRNIFARKQAGTEPGSVRLPFDPVLRQALLDKGIITTAELAGASVKVNMIMDREIRSQHESRGVDDDNSRPQPR